MSDALARVEALAAVGRYLAALNARDTKAIRAAFNFPHMRIGAKGNSSGEKMTQELVAQVNALPGWVKEMGIVILTATAEEVTCEWEVSEKHHQGYGIVHGGVHCGVVETLASIGAAVVAHPRGQNVVGVENNTSFIRAVRSGRLHALAKPVTRGRSSQLWEVWIRDETERLVAQGRVRLLCVDRNRALG